MGLDFNPQPPVNLPLIKHEEFKENGIFADL